MLASRQTILQPLLSSQDGVHLTVYLPNNNDVLELKSQIQTTIDDANEYLIEALSTDERKKFLEPLNALLNDARIFQQMKGNIGIFRNKDTFRILNIPIEVERTCQVATSFHVKPLLRWLQGDQEFLFLGLEKEAAYLYLGSQNSFKLLHSFLFSNIKESMNRQISRKSNPAKKSKNTEIFSWLNEKILSLTQKSKPKLFMAGRPSLVKALNRNLNYSHSIHTAVTDHFSHLNAIEACEYIRKTLKDESKKTLEKLLLEFRFAEEENRVKKNIFQISKAVVQGKVRKLIVTDELSIFGKIDLKSGGLAIHPADLDHEDDCILDDLAQMVLNQGGEVVVAKRDEIPKGRPILAILDDDHLFLEKAKEVNQYSVLQERFG